MRLSYRHVRRWLEEEVDFPVNKPWALWLLRHCYKRFRQPQRATSLDPLLVRRPLEGGVLKACDLAQPSGLYYHDANGRLRKLGPASRKRQGVSTPRVRPIRGPTATATGAERA